MNCISIRFYGVLNDLLQPDQRYKAFSHAFNGQPSVKDLIESLGVPHPEVDLLLIDGQSADFSTQLHGGERLAVYPVFKNLDIAAVSLVRPAPLPAYRFTLDVHLGKLAAYLRMVGFDAHYSNAASKHQLVDDSVTDVRILLTFDRALLMRKEIRYGYIVRSRTPALQLAEVLDRFQLADRLRPFEKCMRCNGDLIAVAKEDVFARLPPNISETMNEFHICPSCGRIYWQGTHYRRMHAFIRQMMEKLHDDPIIRPE